MKMFRRVFDYIKGFVNFDCEECQCKADNIKEIKKQLEKLQTRCNKKRGGKEYVKQNKELVIKKRK